MGTKAYLTVAVVVFFAATSGADIIAKTSISGDTFLVALREHFYWAGMQFVGTMFLLAPFIAVAMTCGVAERRARSRWVIAIFFVAMSVLLYFYFEGYQAAEHAMLREMWTAATLSVGLLPFFIGIPVVLAAIGAGAIAAVLDPRMPA